MSGYQEKFEGIVENVAAWRDELGVPGVTYGVHIGGETYTSGSGAMRAG